MVEYVHTNIKYKDYIFFYFTVWLRQLRFGTFGAPELWRGNMGSYQVSFLLLLSDHEDEEIIS